MLYNVVLVSAVQQHESALSIHISLPLEPPHPSHPSRLSSSTELSSCVIQQLFIWWYRYVSSVLSVHPSLSASSPAVSILYICISTPALQKGSSVPFLLGFIYKHDCS